MVVECRVGSKGKWVKLVCAVHMPGSLSLWIDVWVCVKRGLLMTCIAHPLLTNSAFICTSLLDNYCFTIIFYSLSMTSFSVLWVIFEKAPWMMHQCKTHHNKVTVYINEPSNLMLGNMPLSWIRRRLIPESLWQNNWRRAPHLSRHFLLKILLSSIRLHSRNALYKAEDDTVTLRSPYSVFFSIRMVVMFVGFGYLVCRGAAFLSPVVSP